MDEIFEYWLTTKGILKGETPNKSRNLYKAYRRFVEQAFDGEVRPLDKTAFTTNLEVLGFKKRLHRGVTCWLLNKAVVPVNTLVGQKPRAEIDRVMSRVKV